MRTMIMPKPSVTTTQTTEVQLSPALRTKLLKKLKAFQVNKQAIEAAEAANKSLKEDIDELFAEAGEFDSLSAGVKIDGFFTKYVTPVRSTLDKKKLLMQGVTTAMIEAATVTAPGKAYTQVRCPDERDD
jgi:hypothetical protein